MDSPTQDELIEVASRLRMAIVPLSRQLQRRVAEGFTPTQLSVLSTINRDGPLRLGDLATRERLSLPRISNVVASLEEEGMVQRRDGSDDRRVSVIELTERGRAWVIESRVVRDAWLASQLAHLTQTDLAALPLVIRLLERLTTED